MTTTKTLPQSLKITIEYEITLEDYLEDCAENEETPSFQGMLDSLRDRAAQDMREDGYNNAHWADVYDHEGDKVC